MHINDIFLGFVQAREEAVEQRRKDIEAGRQQMTG
jgi:hypothetical protein